MPGKNRLLESTHRKYTYLSPIMTAYPHSSQNSLGSEQYFKLQMSAVTCKSVMVSPTTNFEIQNLHVKHSTMLSFYEDKYLCISYN